jgi:hypothetical protein
MIRNAFLGGAALSTLTNVPIVPTGYSGAGRIAGTVSTPGSNPGSLPTYQININESGPFFNSGAFYPPKIGGQPTAGGSQRFQGFALLHEIGHITGTLQPEGASPNTNMGIEAANNSALASNCNNALSSLSNAAPH